MGHEEPYFYVRPQDVHGDQLSLVGQEAKHACSVLRMGRGERLKAVDGMGLEYLADITFISSHVAHARILKTTRRVREPICRLTLVQGVIKRGRMDIVVEKATELGVVSIIPLVTERSVVRPGKDKVDRWRRVALAAMKQSGRSVLPSIEEVMDLPTAIEMSRDSDVAIVAWEGEQKVSIADVIEPNFRTVMLLVGPEGGFSFQEIELCKAADMQVVSLGLRRLRSETATIVALSIVLHRLGDL